MGILAVRIDKIIDYFIDNIKKRRSEVIKSNTKEVNVLYDTLVSFIKTCPANHPINRLSYNDENETIEYGRLRLARLTKKSNALKIEFVSSKILAELFLNFKLL